jgi:hypothetical protein
MNTVLVVIAIIGRLQVPQYVVRYPTQQLCEQVADAINKRHQETGLFSREPQARCVPEVKQ